MDMQGYQKHFDLQTRLRSCRLQINEEKEGIITDVAERYVKTMTQNISKSFSPDISKVLDAFFIFDSLYI